MDQELKAYLDEHFGRMDERFGRLEDRVDENSRQIVGLHEEVGGLREEVGGLREEVRHTGVLVEAVRSDVRLVAEGVMGAIEQQEAHRNEVSAGFQEVKASIAPAYQNLDRRLQWLEARAKRQDRDVLEVLREKFGISQA